MSRPTHHATVAHGGNVASRQTSSSALLLFLTFMVLLWTILCAISHKAPDLDGMEELVWASSFELGYTKHPPFPSWVLYAMTWVFGKPVWLPFLAGMLTSALALWFVWKLGCEFTSPNRALIATLLISTIMYFSLRGTIYNHNTAQLWSITACIWLFYRALRYQKASSWIWLGVVAALSTMTKYSAFIQFAVFFIFMAYQGHLRQASTWKGIAIAFVFYVLVISPHVYWLIVNDFAPLRYVDGSIEASSYLGVLAGIVSFSLDQLARISPLLVIALGLLYWNRRSGNRGVTSYAGDLAAWDRSFLLWVGLGPFLLTLLVSALFGMRLVASWGSTFFVLYGFFVFWWLSGDERINLRRAAVVVVLVHILMALGYAVARGPLAHSTGRTARSTFPGPEISAQMQAVWAEHVPDVPLRLVASDTWFGGNIAVHAGPETHVLINGGYAESPWLDPATALQCGVLVAYSKTTRADPDRRLVALYEQATWRGHTHLPWSSEKSPTIVIDWGIIPPIDDCEG